MSIKRNTWSARRRVLRRQLRNLKDNAQDYLGTLSDRQRELLLESSRQLLRSDEAWLQERADWFTQLAVLLERRPQWQQRVRAAVAARQDNFSPEYVHIYKHNMGVIADAIAQLLKGRSEQQDLHLRKKLSGLRTDLETLIDEVQAPADSPSI